MAVDAELLDRWVRQLRASSWLDPATASGSLPKVPTTTLGTLPTATADYRGRVIMVYGAAGVADAFYVCTKSAADTYSWVALPGADLSAIDFLVGTTTGLLSGEIVVGTTPGGELGGTHAAPTVDTVHSGSKHAVISRTFDATEHTTTSTSAVTMVDLSGLSIPVTSGLIIKGSVRKTTGHASRCALGLGINATVIGEAQTAVAANAVWRSGNLSAAENGTFSIEIGPRDTNYLHSIIGQCFAPPNEDPRFSYLINTADLPNATITDVLIRGICDNALNTVAIKNVAVFEVIY